MYGCIESCALFREMSRSFGNYRTRCDAREADGACQVHVQRKTRVDKDVRRTDRTQPFFAGPKNPNVKALRRICLSYTMYNFDLSYCQVRGSTALPGTHTIFTAANCAPSACPLL